ncbi:transcriptional regulator FeaR [Marinobacter sp. TBZ242]|uniref:Transcriptional regulator FeaR n=1 Tax=Marinobacter azerbaijanicus TaxID=3050455 RepID=A0ABT7IE53_9GAMM|nr:transcriptional regulator FeaR [Marinobacter sp. TBZ242]MDL0431478.1 transcriptional regulator FeaR [Marinobacter sp. TBZ242]
MVRSSFAAEEFDRWISDVNQICGPFSAEPLEGTFSGDIHKMGGGAIDMSRVSIRGAQLVRGRSEIRRCGTPEFFCVFQLHGTSRVEQAGNRSILKTGDIVLVDSALPFSFTYDHESQQISLILPRSVIERILNLSGIELGVRIPSHSHIASVANRLIAEAAHYDSLDEEEGSAIVDSLIMLIKPSVIKSLADSNPNERVFLQAVSFIQNNIGEPDLSARMVATTTGASVRSLYRAFAVRSLTVSGYIKTQRMEMCADYMKTSKGKLNLTEVGYRFGFASPSAFSTAFKQYFGVTPSGYCKSCAT